VNKPAVSQAQIEPRGLQREVAARYVGISPTKFDQMVLDGRMPHPKRIDGRKVWDRHALDEAFDELPTEAGENEWDRLTA
jgi:predicted DNA-binding transcriptional regulator AlpA